MELYIHLPFCKSKCLYCNFNSKPCNSLSKISSYVEALIKELILSSYKYSKAKIETIYIGGGTPSFIDTKLIEKIINAVYKNFNVNNDIEFTIEGNPESIDNEKLQAYKSFGINRVSMGVQSLNDDNLKAIGRIHTASEALIKLDLISKNFNNFSTDLIIGLPYDNEKIIQDEVKRLGNICPHISMYELQLEEGTKLYDLVKDNKIKVKDDDEVVDLFKVAYSEAYNLGFIRYEVSNFAKPLCFAKHNYGYWEREEYIGLGAGASSFYKTIDGENLLKDQVRCTNLEDVDEYIKNINAVKRYDDIKKINTEYLNKDDIRYEEIILGLRTSKGVKAQLIKDQLNNKAYLKKYFNDKNGNLSLTDEGFQIMNHILVELT